MDRRRFLQVAAASVAVPAVAGCAPDKAADPDVPQLDFDADSTAEEVTEGIDLTGKLAVVTGCNSGIGFETMRVLAARGAYVIGTGRTLAKAEAACSKVVGVTTPLALELSDFDSVVACADAIRSLRVPIDILVLNAGMRGGDHTAIDGIEQHFRVNHLGHFLLVNRLIDRMYFAYQGRVVVVSSRTAYRDAPDVGIEFDNIEGSRDYSVSKAYAHSKLANALFSLELSRLLRGSRITSNALHPGVIYTNIVEDEPWYIRAGFSVLTSMRGKSLEQGAATSCVVATNPVLGSVTGAWFEDCNAVRVPGQHHLYNGDMASQLWLKSEELLGDYIVRHSTPDPSDLKPGWQRAFSEDG